MDARRDILAYPGATAQPDDWTRFGDDGAASRSGSHSSATGTPPATLIATTNPACPPTRSADGLGMKGVHGAHARLEEGHNIRSQLYR